MDRDDGAPEASSAEAVMVAMQRSLDAVRDVLETTSHQAAVIASLEAELAREADHARALEGETARLRAELTAGRRLPDEIEALIEEQNVLTHLFVASDRLARARAPGEALEVAVEVLHNLAGVHRYGVWLRPSSDARLRLVAPADARYRPAASAGELVGRALGGGVVARAAGGADVPVAYPLLLDGRAVGAIEIRRAGASRRPAAGPPARGPAPVPVGPPGDGAVPGRAGRPRGAGRGLVRCRDHDGGDESMSERWALVIEDSPTMRQLLTLALRRIPGLGFAEATNGAEALDLLVERAFDVILLDLNMPVMDGFQFLEHLAKRGARPPIIVVSTESGAADQERARELGVVAYVTKPVRGHDLYATVTRVLDEAGGAGE